MHAHVLCSFFFSRSPSFRSLIAPSCGPSLDRSRAELHQAGLLARVSGQKSATVFQSVGISYAFSTAFLDAFSSHSSPPPPHTHLFMCSVSATADLCLPEGELYVGVTARDSLLHGRISVDASSRTISYCKDLAIPNGLTLAVDAGLQYVGARPLPPPPPPPPARAARRAAPRREESYDIARSPPGGYPSFGSEESGDEAGTTGGGRAARRRSPYGASYLAEPRESSYGSAYRAEPYGSASADASAPASELLSRYASAAAFEIRRRVRPFVGFQVWAGGNGQGGSGRGEPTSGGLGLGGFERTALAPDGSLVFCRAVTLPPRLIGFSYPKVSADAAVSVAFPAYQLGGVGLGLGGGGAGAAGPPGGGLFLGTPGGSGIGLGGSPRRGGGGGWRLGAGGWRLGGAAAARRRQQEDEERLAATPNRDLVSIRVEAYDIVFDF